MGNAVSIANFPGFRGISQLNQRIRTQISCWFSIFGLALLFSASGTVLAQGLRSDGDLGAQWRVNSTARLLAGLAPWHPAHLDFAKTDAWKEHSSAMQGAWGQLTANRIKPMASWREATIQSPCPAGKTLLYPFSGPDFFNAYWLFPDCDSYVMFGLEHIGELPTIENMNEKQVAKLVADVRTATSDLFDRNYFITDHQESMLIAQDVTLNHHATSLIDRNLISGFNFLLRH